MAGRLAAVVAAGIVSGFVAAANCFTAVAAAVVVAAVRVDCFRLLACDVRFEAVPVRSDISFA